MKKEFFAAVLAGTMLLAGCANAAPPATVTTVGTSAPTVKPTETVPSTTAPTTAPTTEPVKPTDPDYDEYFSKVETEFPDWSGEHMAVAYAKDDQVFLRRDGTTETVFESSYGRVFPDQLGWLGYCTSFQAGIDEETDGFYRIYGPTGQVDLLVSGIPHAECINAYEVSNVEVIVVRPTAECLEVCREVWDTSDQAFTVNKDGSLSYGTPREIWGDGQDFSFDLVRKSPADPAFVSLVRAALMERGYPAAMRNTLYYYNTLTGAEYTIQVVGDMPTKAVGDGITATYPDGTERPEEMLEKNSSSWWLDDYYTK